MKDRVRKTMRRHAMLADGARVHVAVSGGVDSVVLLHVLRSMGFACSVVHIDHGLRGPESDADRAFVQELCAQLRVPCLVFQVDVEARMSSGGISKQMAARELRYEVFQSLHADGAPIALAHHRDDALETFFLHLLRGTGSNGWATIPPKVGAFIRPFIDVDRLRIEAYASEHGINFREDTSNTSDAYLRNRVRHELLPLMEALRPGARSTIARSLSALRELTALAKEYEATLPRLEEGDGDLGVPSERVLRSAAPLLTLRALVGEGAHPELFEDLHTALIEKKVGATFPLPGRTVFVDRQRLVVVRDAYPTGPWIIDAPTGAVGDLPLSVSVVSPRDVDLSQGPEVAWLDLDRLAFPLELRRWRAGDSMRPIGTGSKLISDILTDAKVPAHRKAEALVLVSCGVVVWLCGYRVAEGFQATHESGRVLRVERRVGA